jgi:hypothetical protein
MTTAEHRREKVRQAAYNLFHLHADDVLIDLLTDSGTGAMSRDQWAAIQHGDESYAGSPSYFASATRSRSSSRSEHVIPTHQGRAAEKILFGDLPARQGRPEQHPLRHHAGQRRVHRRRGRGPRHRRRAATRHPRTRSRATWTSRALEQLLASPAATTSPVVFVTVTNNSGGGQPVSWRTCARSARCATATASRCSSTPAASRRTPGSSRARARPGGSRRPRHRARDGGPGRRDDDVGQEGPWQHRRLAGLDDDDLAEQCRNLLILTEGFPPTAAWPAATWRRSRRGCGGRRARLPALPDPLHGLPGRGARAAGVPSSSRSAATPSTSTRGRCCRTSRPLEYPGQALAVELYVEPGASAPARSAPSCSAPPDGTETPGGDGPRAAGHPAPHVHAEPHRLRHRGRASGSWPRPATGSSRSCPAWLRGSPDPDRQPATLQLRALHGELASSRRSLVQRPAVTHPIRCRGRTASCRRVPR